MMTKEQIQSLPAPLQQKLKTLPQGTTVGYFTEDEQESLAAVLGDGWASVLGVSAE